MNPHTTFSWETIKTDVSRPADSPIEKLMEYVIESGLSEYLHVATFLVNLRVGRSKNFSRNDGELTIEYIEATDSVLFSYFDSIDSKPWEKECSLSLIHI